MKTSNTKNREGRQDDNHSYLTKKINILLLPPIRLLDELIEFASPARLGGRGKQYFITF
jgi:hypothetical protein